VRESRGLLPEAQEPSSVLFVGDMMFDRGIRTIAEEKGYLHMFSCAKDLLLAQTVVVGNLEGPITNNDSVSQGTVPGSTDNYQFTFDPAVTDALLLSNIGYVNLGNNHIFNFGREGLLETRQYLSKAGIGYFGDPLLGTSSVARLPLPARAISLISYNKFWEPDATSTETLIEKEKSKGSFVVVYAHWGEEYASSSDSQAGLARRFIEAGADTVVGSHPHVIQEVEEYLGRPIFYSLGNFIFDKWFSEEVMRGMGVRISFGPGVDEPTYETVTFKINRDGTTCPVIEIEET
jgi:gamma-polyglutamate biosynthesis protein CapA